MADSKTKTAYSLFPINSQTAAGNSETLRTVGYGMVTYDVGGSDRTGVILEAASNNGDVIVVTNISTTNQLTFATDATSHVAGGTGVIIAANQAAMFIYNATTLLWYPVPASVSGALSAGSVTATELASDAVTTVKIADGDVTLAKLDAGIVPSHIAKFGANYTTVGGNAVEAITVTGAEATDLCFVQLRNDGTNNVSVLSAVTSTNTLTVTFSADPGNDAIISYVVLRAAA